MRKHRPVVAIALAVMCSAASCAAPRHATRRTTTTSTSTSTTAFVSTTVSSIGASSSATVTTAVSSHPSSGATAPAPTLRILSPHDGEQFSLPADIHYSVQGWRPALGSARLLVYPGTDPAASFVITLVIDPSGDVVVLEDDKRLPGRKDLTFQLASAEHGPIDGPGARQTLREVRISGSR